MSTADGSLLAGLVSRAIRQCGRPEQVRAILIKGSAGETGVVPLGGDLDLLVVTVDPPGDDWFAELRVDGVPVEIFVRDEASMADVDEILRHQSLPFELVHNLHTDDRHGILARARDAVRPSLLLPDYLLERAEASHAGARQALSQAWDLMEAGRSGEAARSLSVALWHGAAAAASATAMKPTTRRCLAVWATAAKTLGVGRQVGLLDAAVGRHLDSSGRTTLVALLEAADYRVAGAVEGMVQAGEERWAVYPILRSTLWSPMAERHSEKVRRAVLQAVGWDEAGLAERIGSARELIAGLDDLIHRGVRELAGDSTTP